jgi:predicted MPP superfamily phosphohydrolase
MKNLFAAAVWMAAGACLYLALLNRYLLQMGDRRYKRLKIYGTFVVIAGCAAAAGCLTGLSVWLVLPLAGLLLIGVGELRRLALRRHYRGAPPVKRENQGISILKPDTTTDLALLHYDIRVPTWSGGSLCVAHISDLHVTDELPREYYRRALLRASAAQPDMILFSGDFVTEVKYASLLAEILPAARAPLGVLAILGNHDHWAGSDEVRAALHSAGVVVLGNDCLRVRAGGGDVLVVGCESPWGKDGWQAPPIQPHELALALTHTPDNIYRLRAAGMHALFAGHYHAGQFRVPGLGALVMPSRYGRRFDQGHFVVNGTHLFVSAGVGSVSPPLRLYCQPDVLLVNIRGSNA